MANSYMTPHGNKKNKISDMISGFSSKDGSQKHCEKWKRPDKKVPYGRLLCHRFSSGKGKSQKKKVHESCPAQRYRHTKDHFKQFKLLKKKKKLDGLNTSYWHVNIFLTFYSRKPNSSLQLSNGEIKTHTKKQIHNEQYKDHMLHIETLKTSC